MSVKKATKENPALALVAEARGKSGVTRIPPNAVAALRTILEHNDTLPRTASAGRVSARAVLTMLREHYGVQLADTSRNVLDCIARRDLGRKSWGTP